MWIENADIILRAAVVSVHCATLRFTPLRFMDARASHAEVSKNEVC